VRAVLPRWCQLHLCWEDLKVEERRQASLEPCLIVNLDNGRAVCGSRLDWSTSPVSCPHMSSSLLIAERSIMSPEYITTSEVYSLESASHSITQLFCLELVQNSYNLRGRLHVASSMYCKDKLSIRPTSWPKSSRSSFLKPSLRAAAFGCSRGNFGGQLR